MMNLKMLDEDVDEEDDEGACVCRSASDLQPSRLSK
jgi:hypothetical protein